MGYLSGLAAGGCAAAWRQLAALGLPASLNSLLCRDECRRRMVQGEFEVGGGGGPGLPGPGQGAAPHPAGAPGQPGQPAAAKLPAPDSPVSDVNSILAGAHLQVGDVKFWFRNHWKECLHLPDSGRGQVCALGLSDLIITRCPDYLLATLATKLTTSLSVVRT